MLVRAFSQHQVCHVPALINNGAVANAMRCDDGGDYVTVDTEFIREKTIGQNYVSANC